MLEFWAKADISDAAQGSLEAELFSLKATSIFALKGFSWLVEDYPCYEHNFILKVYWLKC
jgi:hypothetical protein